MSELILKCKLSGGGQLHRFQLSIPIGYVELTSCQHGLHSLRINKSSVCDKQRQDLISFKEKVREFKSVQVLDGPVNGCKSIQESLEYFRKYFCHYTDGESHSTLDSHDLPTVCWSGICKQDTFSEKVLKTLFYRVNPGERISYKSLASLAGNANAQRAVGSIMRKNPIAILIPCHRVIKTNESIGNYNGGVEIKQWLLDHESAHFTSSSLS